MNERINKLKSFLAESPNDNFIIHALALEYAKLNEVAEAKKYFEMNISLDPNYVATYYHFGKLYEQNKQEEEAIAIYARGMEIAKAIGDSHAFGELRSIYEELTF